VSLNAQVYFNLMKKKQQVLKERLHGAQK